jgi:hypothetical protein
MDLIIRADNATVSKIENSFFDVEAIQTAVSIFSKIFYDILSANTSMNMNKTMLNSSLENTTHAVAVLTPPLPHHSPVNLTVDPHLQQIASALKAAILPIVDQTPQRLLSAPNETADNPLEQVYHWLPSFAQMRLQKLFPDCVEKASPFSYNSFKNCAWTATSSTSQQILQKTALLLSSKQTLQNLASWSFESLQDTLEEIYKSKAPSSETLSLSPFKQKALTTAFALCLIAAIFFQATRKRKISLYPLVSTTVSLTFNLLFFSMIQHSLSKEIPLKGRIAMATTSLIGLHLGGALLSEAVRKIFERAKTLTGSILHSSLVLGSIAITGYLDHATQENPPLNQLIHIAGGVLIGGSIAYPLLSKSQTTALDPGIVEVRKKKRHKKKCAKGAAIPAQA